MRVGFVGLGKLGLPVALAVESRGHNVVGYDINPNVAKYLQDKQIPFKEKGIQSLLDNNKIEIKENIKEVVAASDIIFVPIQTPHEAQFEGATRIPDERCDFDYTWLKEGVKAVSDSAEELGKYVTVVVISTCLPGTYEREIKPLINEDYIDYIYNPFFIGMGNVIDDFLNPEFVLIGSDENGRLEEVYDFYKTIHNKRLLFTDITTAECIKVSYNTIITMKTVVANTWGELAHKVGANVDDIYKAWSLATDRIISPKYLKAGMGDGGGCHPRDNIALSYIAKQVDLSHNIFEDLMAAREDHAEWLADLIMEQDTSLPTIILGRSFKPETNIETGSPAILVSNILAEKGHDHAHLEDANTEQRALWFIGTQHERYRDIKFKEGSIVIDPFGYIEDQTGVKVIRIGRP